MQQVLVTRKQLKKIRRAPLRPDHTTVFEPLICSFAKEIRKPLYQWTCNIFLASFLASNHHCVGVEAFVNKEGFISALVQYADRYSFFAPASKAWRKAPRQRRITTWVARYSTASRPLDIFANRHPLAPQEVDLCSSLANFKNLGLLQLARDHGRLWSKGTRSLAPQRGHLKVIGWFVDNSCLWEEGTCSEATKEEQLHILILALENGCPWDVRRRQQFSVGWLPRHPSTNAGMCLPLG